MDILHIRRYSGMNYDDIVGDIMHNHTAFCGTAIASDFGVGAVYNSKIRETCPTPPLNCAFLPSAHGTPNRKPVTETDTLTSGQISHWRFGWQNGAHF